LAADVDLSPSYFKLNITRGTSSSLDKHVLHFHSITLKSKLKKKLPVARSLPFLILYPLSLFRADRNIFCSLHSDVGHDVLLSLSLSFSHTQRDIQASHWQDTGDKGKQGKRYSIYTWSFLRRCIFYSSKEHMHALIPICVISSV